MRPARDVDPAVLRAAYGTFPSGVVAVCAQHDGRPVGMAASSFVAVSLDPPLVMVCVQHTSTTWPVLADRPHLGVSVLAEDQGIACRQLAASGTDRFAGLAVTTTAGGAVLINGAAAWMDCSIHDVVTAGDHDLVLMSVDALQIHAAAAPLVFHASAFRSLVAA